VFTQTF